MHTYRQIYRHTDKAHILYVYAGLTQACPYHLLDVTVTHVSQGMRAWTHFTSGICSMNNYRQGEKFPLVKNVHDICNSTYI